MGRRSICNSRLIVLVLMFAWNSSPSATTLLSLQMHYCCFLVFIILWGLIFLWRWPWSVLSAGMWCRIVGYKFPDLSEERSASVYTIEEWTKQTASRTGSCCHFWSPLSCSAYSSTLRMDALRSSEMSVNFYQITPRHIQEHPRRYFRILVRKMLLLC
jgi:hypothetical protein